MDRNRTVAVLLGVLLGVSGLLNVVAFRKLNEDPPRPGSSGPAPALPEGRPVSAAPGADRSDLVLRELAALRREVAELRGVPPPVAAPPPDAGAASASAAAPPVATIGDPEVAEILNEQTQFRAFWKDLERVFDARGKIDEAKYFETVLDATADYLGIPANARSRFAEMTRVSITDVVQYRQDYEDARRALPSRTSENAAAYDAQRRAMDTRYRDQMKLTVDRMKTQLDLNQARHVEFSGRIDRWLRELAPPRS